MAKWTLLIIIYLATTTKERKTQLQTAATKNICNQQ